ncbi:uncharacterized protein TNCV_1165461 [Trichonephila clavipes]|nr:uncharacterized protein TNCV_1165461 [Trichonephila clavipes]
MDQNGSNTVTDIVVSFDDTWLTRGHTSPIGVGCVVDTLTGYVIDYEIMSKYCPTCISAKNELGETTAEYDIWLASDSLLKGCARFLTQNSNESLHSVIWSKCSKETSAKSRRVNIAVSEAVSEYNFGTLKALKEIQKSANLDLGEEAVKTAATRDYTDVKKKRNHQSNLAFRIARRKVKLANLRKEKYSKKKEGITYSPGFI